MADDTSRAPSSGGTGMQPIDFSAPVPTTPAGGERPGATPGAAAAATCSKCATPIGAYYYESNGAVFCARCKRLTEEADGKGGAAGGGGGTGRGALFGVGAALLGAFGYWAFMTITGIDWALVSIGVGIFVATAIRKGNGGRAGRRFQVLAVALTYLAIGAAYTPAIVEGIRSAGTKSDSTATTSAVASTATAIADSARAALPADTTAAPTTDDVAPAGTAVPARAAHASTSPKPSAGMKIGMFFLAVLVIALVGPVLAIVLGGFPGAIINLAIVGFALRRAWIMAGVGGVATGGHGFTGPYHVGSRPPTSPAATSG